MAKCSKCGSPLCKCGSPNHYSDSPAKQVGFGMASAINQANNAIGLQRQALDLQRQALGKPGSFIKSLMELVRSRMPQEVAPVVNTPEVVDKQVPDANFSAYKKFTEAGIAPGAVNIVTPNIAPEQEVTNVPPPQANEAAIAPVFDQKTQVSANQVFGDLFARQNAVNAPLMFKQESPLKGNAFIAAKIAAEKAGKSSFKVGGKTFPVK
jgi:hypothetical protein